MIVLLLVWIVLAFTSFVWGSAFMALTGPYPQSRPDTSIFFARLWCGIVMQAAAALGLSLAGPVSASRALLLSLAVCFAFVLSPQGRADARQVWLATVAGSWRGALVAMAPVTAAALLFSQAPSNYDTLLYPTHQVVRRVRCSQGPGADP
jgi:hypothetical protein